MSFSSNCPTENPIVDNDSVSVSLILSPLLPIWWSSGISLEFGHWESTGLWMFVLLWPRLGSGLFLKPWHWIWRSDVCLGLKEAHSFWGSQVYLWNCKSVSWRRIWDFEQSAVPVKAESIPQVSSGEHSSLGLLGLQGQHSSVFIVFLLIGMDHITPATANCTLENVLC